MKRARRNMLAKMFQNVGATNLDFEDTGNNHVKVHWTSPYGFRHSFVIGHNKSCPRSDKNNISAIRRIIKNDENRATS